MQFFRKQHEEEVTKLQSLGMEVVQLPEADAVRIDKLMSDTIWAVAEKKSGKVVADLKKMALEKGMTK